MTETKSFSNAILKNAANAKVTVIPKGVLYMVTSAFAFSLMSLLVKVAGQRLPSQEIVLGRAIISLILSYWLIRRAGVQVWGTNRKLLIVRGILGFIALSCFYYSVTHLPLAEATVIQYMHPVFTAIMAACFLGERIGKILIASSILSLAGVTFVTRPAILFGGTVVTLNPVAVTIALCGSVFSAAAYVVVRRLSSIEHPLVIVFYFPLVTVPATIPTVVPLTIWPQAWEWLVLLGIGLTTQVGQVCLTRGLQHEPAGRATAISYLQVVFAIALGAFFYAEYPEPLTVLGSLLVLGGTLVVARQAGQTIH
ncbi:MAG: DMT family transporter [bacterium]